MDPQVKDEELQRESQAPEEEGLEEAPEGQEAEEVGGYGGAVEDTLHTVVLGAESVRLREGDGAEGAGGGAEEGGEGGEEDEEDPES